MRSANVELHPEKVAGVSETTVSNKAFTGLLLVCAGLAFVIYRVDSPHHGQTQKIISDHKQTIEQHVSRETALRSKQSDSADQSHSSINR